MKFTAYNNYFRGLVKNLKAFNATDDNLKAHFSRWIPQHTMEEDEGLREFVNKIKSTAAYPHFILQAPTLKLTGDEGSQYKFKSGAFVVIMQAQASDMDTVENIIDSAEVIGDNIVSAMILANLAQPGSMFFSFQLPSSEPVQIERTLAGMRYDFTWIESADEDMGYDAAAWNDPMDID